VGGRSWGGIASGELAQRNPAAVGVGAAAPVKGWRGWGNTWHGRGGTIGPRGEVRELRWWW
jgi:hypothetical protein